MLSRMALDKSVNEEGFYVIFLLLLYPFNEADLFTKGAFASN